MSQLLVNKKELYYEEAGRGDPVVLVHGSASDYRTWHDQIAPLADDYRVIAYSRRYHRPNEPIPDGADYSMPEHVDDLAALVESLGAAPAHLVGHSYGAFLCLLLAIHNPSLVQSLVLEEPPVLTLFTSSTPKLPELLKLLFTRPRTALALMKFGASGVAPAIAALRRDDIERAIEAFGTATLGRSTYRALSEERKAQVRANFIAAELTGSGFAPLDDTQVRQVTQPVLLLTASHSPALFHRLADRLIELLPQCRTGIVPDASHIMHEDNPSAYNDILRSFFEQIG